jgi:hypothetical protein
MRAIDRSPIGSSSSPSLNTSREYSTSLSTDRSAAVEGGGGRGADCLLSPNRVMPTQMTIITVKIITPTLTKSIVLTELPFPLLSSCAGDSFRSQRNEQICTSIRTLHVAGIGSVVCSTVGSTDGWKVGAGYDFERIV